MSYLDNYRSLVAGLTRGLKHARAQYGIRFYGTIGLYADMVSEGARQAFIARLPGHPEQAEDALNQVGADRDLPRYRGETRASYTSRITSAWDRYAQYGTRQELIRAVSEWMQIVYPPGTPIALAVYERGWANFVLAMFNPPYGAPLNYGGTAPRTYGSVGASYGAPGVVYGFLGGVYYGTGLYGISNVTLEDVTTLTRLVRKIKPSRSKAQIEIVPAGVKIYGPSSTYGSGGLYANGAIVYLNV